MSRTSVLNTTTANYLELIGNGKTYRVPPYQCDYAWTEEEWEDLWNDVLDLRERPEARHYMGALVVKGDSDRDFTIIDGQQRLATIGVLLKYILCRLEDDANDVGKERDPETDPASIEHILPQNPSGDWTDAFTATEVRAAVERIGNATLLDPTVNRDIASAPYAEKRPAYQRSAYALTRQVAEMAPEEWTFAFVEKRQQHLARRAVQVWRSDFV